MKNTTGIKVPKKYHKMIDCLETELQDDSGIVYWLCTAKGYAIGYEGIHVMSELTKREIIADIKTIVPCNCKDCI